MKEIKQDSSCNMYEEFLPPDFRGAGYILQDEEVVLEYVSWYSPINMNG